MRNIIIATILSAIPSIARAEIMVGESIEWMIADSDRVVVGKIVAVKQVGRLEAVTIEVDKTLRGKHEPKVTFLVPNNGGNAAQGWPKAGVPMLFALVERGNVKNSDGLPQEPALVLRRGASEHAAVFLGKPKEQRPGTSEVFTRDFKHLTGADEIVKYVDAYARTLPADWKKKQIVLHVPGNSRVFQKLWAGSSVLLTVPLDPAMETQAREWCRAKDIEARARGATVLGNFKNDENVKILKALLKDPGSYEVTSSQTVNGQRVERKVRFYAARSAAHGALTELGVEVDRPIVEEPIGDGDARLRRSDLDFRRPRAEQ
jgi:hypothetical protein